MFAKFASVAALLFLGLFGVVLAGPVVVNRDITSIVSVLHTLQLSIAGPLGQISTLLPLDPDV
jgi:hypothetical protein